MPLDRARVYVTCWATAVVIAIVLAALRGRTFAIATSAYWRARATPWKLALFAVAALGMMIIAPRTGDPTWDRVDAGFMALFTYLTAPWTLGVLVRAIRARRAPWVEAYVAACTWLFSASWSYDLYIFVRDAGGFSAAWSRGFYPLTWSSNLVASSLLYAAGGACFSLSAPDAPDTRLGVTFSFLEPDWPAERAAPPRRVALLALAFVLVVAAMLGPFVWVALRDH
ncbi:MAG: hypothetical protein HYV09_37115 [Deltaproteobacteria bacterium]|nr:hypothetical protein [Deltaproteobacteria bacterium]